MKEMIAFLLPPAVAFAGMRISRLVLGRNWEDNFGLGLRFALGLAIGMVVFSQTVLLAAVMGANLSGLLAWTALVWGTVEAILLAAKTPAGLKQFKFQPGHLWLLLLLPVIYSWWVFGRLCTLEGTMEFDANAFWVFKAKILYLEQGKNLLHTLHQSNLAYAHLDYPLLVPCLYTLNYGAVGGVDEFVNKVWPFWMVVALCLAVLSLARIWQRPRPLPVLLVVLFCFLPASLQFIREEGGTIPMAFFTSLTALLMMAALVRSSETALAAAVLALAGCANTKFEGMIYTALWGVVILWFCWRRGWLKNRRLWNAVLVAAICLVPYFCFRLTKPVLHPESAWVQDGLASPGAVLRRFPQTWFLNLGCRFFSKDFFQWDTPDKDHLHFAGQWEGFKSLVNPELSVLPWLLLVMFALSFCRQHGCRSALGILLAVMAAQLTVLSLTISCLSDMQTDLSHVIDFASNVVGRYFYPFFAACFLGMMAVWLMDRPALPGMNSHPPHAPAKPGARSKKTK